MLNENNQVVFPYQVNAIMPITGLSIGNLMVPSTVKITKEDVEICIKKVPVFRRFKNGKLVRVTSSSIDRLHNEEFMTEEEYEAHIDKLADNRGKVEAVNVLYGEGIVIDKNPPSLIAEENKKETEVESVVEEADTLIKDEYNDQTEKVTNEASGEIVNDEGISEDVTEEKKNEYNHNRYTNKKKHNR